VSVHGKHKHNILSPTEAHKCHIASMHIFAYAQKAYYYIVGTLAQYQTLIQGPSTRLSYRVPVPGSRTESQYQTLIQSPSTRHSYRVPVPGSHTESQYQALIQSPSTRVPVPGSRTESQYQALVQSPSTRLSYRVPVPDSHTESQYQTLIQSLVLRLRFHCTLPLLSSLASSYIRIPCNVKG